MLGTDMGICLLMRSRESRRSSDSPKTADRLVNSITEAGLGALRNRSNLWTQAMAKALAREFTTDELRLLAVAVPLIERLALRLAI
jgi:hypothetical protein